MSPLQSFDVKEKLQQLGLGDKSALVAQVTKHLSSSTSTTNATWFWVPGRVEFAGKHTDYCGGESIVFAVPKGFLLAATRDEQAPTDDSPGCTITVVHCVTDKKSSGKQESWIYLPPGRTSSTKDEGSTGAAPEPSYAKYFAATWSRLFLNFGLHLRSSWTIYFASDLPRASGLSSSSALVVAAFLFAENLSKIGELCDTEGPEKPLRNFSLTREKLRENPADLAAYLGCCENGAPFASSDGSTQLAGSSGVGTFGGSEDHAAILGVGRVEQLDQASEDGATINSSSVLTRLSFCPAKVVETLPWPTEDYVFIIASSGVLAEKAGGVMQDYNNAVFLARKAIEGIDRYVKKEQGEAETANLIDILPSTSSTLQAAVQSLRAIIPNVEEMDSTDGSQSRSVAHDATIDVLQAALVEMSHTDREVDQTLAAAICERAVQFANEMELIRHLARALRDYKSSAPAPLAGSSEAQQEKEKANKFENTLRTCFQESQDGSDIGLHNIIAETAYLPAAALDLGAVASSAFGAGFGGSVFAVVRRSVADSFLAAWEEDYYESFPQRKDAAEFFVVEKPAVGAQLLF
ncbi:unnamed protein product [Amoebophrya sp. A120]|nr:unnamed protein product [Amoebophrya sp. A120]|eukprot:GSA120T00012920001.1